MEYRSRLPVLCPQHPDRSLEQLCCDCSLALCWKCLVADHGPHRVRDLEPQDLLDPALCVPGARRMRAGSNSSDSSNDSVTMTTPTTPTAAPTMLVLDRDCKDAFIPLNGDRKGGLPSRDEDAHFRKAAPESAGGDGRVRASRF